MLIIEFSVQNGYAKLLKVTFYNCEIIVEYKLFINVNYRDLEDKFDMANYLKYLSIIVKL